MHRWYSWVQPFECHLWSPGYLLGVPKFGRGRPRLVALENFLQGIEYRSATTTIEVCYMHKATRTSTYANGMHICIRIYTYAYLHTHHIYTCMSLSLARWVHLLIRVNINMQRHTHTRTFVQRIHKDRNWLGGFLQKLCQNACGSAVVHVTNPWVSFEGGLTRPGSDLGDITRVGSTSFSKGRGDAPATVKAVVKRPILAYPGYHLYSFLWKISSMKWFRMI